MRVEAGLDTGGVYAQRSVPIGVRTADELRAELVDVGTSLLLDTFTSGLGTPAQQFGEPVYAAKIDPAEMRIDWSLPAEQIDRLVRLGHAWTMFRGRRLKVLEAAPLSMVAPGAPGSVVGDVVSCGSGGVRLVTVQPEGKAAMAASAWLNGARPTADDRLGE